jgi:hypothetical protein
MLELEPLHEEAHRALMWFLATGGQRGAALAQFDTCRYLLREELGQEPSTATATLRDEIARTGEFTKLPPVDSPARPSQRWATLPVGAPSTGGWGSSAPGGTGSKLLGALTSLVGREEDLARLQGLLDDPACRLVTLVGPGGIGKTRLGLEVGAAREGRYRDGVVTVSFVGPARRGRRRRPTWW